MALSSTAFAGGDDLCCIGHDIALLLLPNAFSLALGYKKKGANSLSILV